MVKKISKGSLLGRSFSSSKDKTGLYLVSIVAIVAIVALFLMVKGGSSEVSGETVMVADEGGNLIGEVFRYFGRGALRQELPQLEISNIIKHNSPNKPGVQGGEEDDPCITVDITLEDGTELRVAGGNKELCPNGCMEDLMAQTPLDQWKPDNLPNGGAQRQAIKEQMAKQLGVSIGEVEYIGICDHQKRCKQAKELLGRLGAGNDPNANAERCTGGANDPCLRDDEPKEGDQDFVGPPASGSGDSDPPPAGTPLPLPGDKGAPKTPKSGSGDGATSKPQAKPKSESIIPETPGLPFDLGPIKGEVDIDIDTSEPFGSKLRVKGSFIDCPAEMDCSGQSYLDILRDILGSQGISDEDIEVIMGENLAWWVQPRDDQGEDDVPEFEPEENLCVEGVPDDVVNPGEAGFPECTSACPPQNKKTGSPCDFNTPASRDAPQNTPTDYCVGYKDPCAAMECTEGKHCTEGICVSDAGGDDGEEPDQGFGGGGGRPGWQ